jgi:hypothetical protein
MKASQPKDEKVLYESTWLCFSISMEYKEAHHIAILCVVCLSKKNSFTFTVLAASGQMKLDVSSPGRRQPVIQTC